MVIKKDTDLSSSINKNISYTHKVYLFFEDSLYSALLVVTTDIHSFKKVYLLRIQYHSGKTSAIEQKNLF